MKGSGNLISSKFERACYYYQRTFISYPRRSIEDYESDNTRRVNTMYVDLLSLQLSAIHYRLLTTNTTTIPNELLTGRYSLDPKNPCLMILAEAKTILLTDQKHTK
jgi:hypothetical protein